MPVCILVPASIVPFIVDNRVHAHIPVEYIVGMLSLAVVCGTSLLSLVVNFKSYRKTKFGSVLVKINAIIFVISFALFFYFS